MSLSINIGRPFLNDKTLDEQARSILRLYGTDAHVYLPGAGGVAVSGLLSNNYTLSDGSTGYSTVDGTAGLVLDGAGSVGAERVTNGDFDVDASWTKGAGWTISGGAAVLTAAVGILSQSLIITAGSTYQVSVDTGLNYQLRLSGVNLGYYAGNKTLFVVAAAGGLFEFIPNGAQTGTIDNISVKEVTGIHATQATTANKPALRRGLYNLLTYSNDLTNAAWSKGLASVSGSTVTATAGAGNHYVQQAKVGAATAGGVVSILFSLSQGTSRYALIGEDGDASLHVAVLDFQTGSISSQTNCTATAVQVGSSWLMCATYTRTNAGNIYPTVTPVLSGSATNFSYTAAGTETVIANAGCLVNGQITAQQALSEGGIPLTTSTAASNSGAGRYWHQYGGTHSMNFSAVPFQQADDHVVVVAVRPTSTGGTTNVFDVSNSGLANPLCARIVLSAGVMYAQWRDDAGTLVSLTGPSFTAGEAFVVTARSVGGVRTIRKNGVVAATSSSALGATTLNQAIFGAAYTGASGTIIPIKGALSDADVLTIERNVAANMIAAPTF